MMSSCLLRMPIISRTMRPLVVCNEKSFCLDRISLWWFLWFLWILTIFAISGPKKHDICEFGYFVGKINLNDIIMSSDDLFNLKIYNFKNWHIICYLELCYSYIMCLVIFILSWISCFWSSIKRINKWLTYLNTQS